MNEKIPCSACGEELEASEVKWLADRPLCPDCFEELTVACSRCGERIWVEDNAGDTGTYLCQDCYDQHYTTCDECGRVIHLDEAYYEDFDNDHPLCWTCYSRIQQDTGVHNYYFKPAPIFYGQGPRYFGLELEVDLGGESNKNAKVLLDIANGWEGDRLYIKHDGSLNDGFELVSHPMSLSYHLHEMPWKELLQEAKNMGYRSHQTSTCGLHIHVSREAFGETDDEQDRAIARILYFVERHWEELLKFSRRTPRQLERWAARYGFKDQPVEILDHAKKGGHAGRYSCINLENSATVEFRIFRGTLKYNTLIATLQLVERVCDVALFLSDEEVKAMSWTTFVAGCQTPELVQYLKERRLYVNEPVEMEEEV